MKSIFNILPWKRGLVLSILTLLILVVSSFYGLYTNKFYFFKFDNYLIPLVTLVHFAFLYVLWFKIKEGEVTDPQMRNLEYALYVILPIYAYKLINTIAILFSANDFENHIIPSTFIPIGLLVLTAYILIIALTLLAFQYRKVLVGNYNFDEINRHIDTWE
ncbi:hypothetical protein [Maribacter sp. 2-571]|uniref:hypothetical protein n=1 Tax=Maribacter sp. 2-571 TaxID=3417569 RepID=UPI003D33DCEF